MNSGSHITDRLSRLLDRLQEIAERDFRGLNEFQFIWKAHPDKWSVAECLRHIALILENQLPELEKAVEKAPKISGQSTSFNSGFFGKIMLNRVLIKDDNSIRKLAKCPKKLRPEKNLEHYAELLLDDFFSGTGRLISVLDKARFADLESNRLGMPHFPYFKLRLGDMLQFTVHHIERHVVQAQKVLMEDNFPKNSAC